MKNSKKILSLGLGAFSIFSTGVMLHQNIAASVGGGELTLQWQSGQRLLLRDNMFLYRINLDNNTALIDKCDDAVTDGCELDIPSKITFDGKDFDVVIGENFFERCNDLKSVVLPGGRLGEYIVENGVVYRDFGGYRGLILITKDALKKGMVSIPADVKSLGAYSAKIDGHVTLDLSDTDFVDPEDQDHDVIDDKLFEVLVSGKINISDDFSIFVPYAKLNDDIKDVIRKYAETETPIDGGIVWKII